LGTTARPPNGECYQAGNLVIDVARQRVTRDGVEIALPRLSFDLLVALTRAFPRMLSIDELMDTVWAHAVVNPETVSQRVKLLRQSLGGDTGGTRLIVGVRGRGYRLDVPTVRPVGETDDLTSGPQARLTQPSAPSEPAARQVEMPIRAGANGRGWTSSRRLLGIIAATLLVGVGLLIVRRLWTSSVAPTRIAATANAGNGSSIAVLPFLDLSEKKDQEYFSDGLTEELSSELAQITDLRVAGRTSSFSFKGKNEDLRVIGAKLGVNHLLEGSVRKAGDKLRITAQLINATDGTHLWSKSYDSKLDDVFAVQEEIAQDVANKLSVTLGLAGSAAAPGGTTNVEAYESYLRARAHVEGGGPEDYQLALAQYRRAVELDPTYARAWCDLSAALEYSLVFSPKNRDAVLREMSDAGERALALAPNVWWTDAMRARRLMAQHQWAQAESAAKRVLAEAPASQTDAIYEYANFLQIVGRIKDALPYFEKMRDSDPLSLRVSGYLQVALRAALQPASAQTEYERSKDLAGNHNEWDWYATLRLWSQKSSDPATVAASFEKFVDEEHGEMIPYGRGLSAVLQDPLRAREAIRVAAKDSAVWNSWPRVTTLALIADHFGDKDLAIEALRRRLELTDSHYIAWWPYQTGLRTDPRFRQILQNLKLVDYYRTSGNWGDFCHPLGSDNFECQ
jgi:TolB-like protein/DNA-binding winged helix-turn-helix (wHTH) protein